MKKKADDLTKENRKQDSLIQGLRIQLKNTPLILESKDTDRDTTGIPSKDTSGNQLLRSGMPKETLIGIQIGIPKRNPKRYLRNPIGGIGFGIV
jgi:hypothetical protein